MGQSANRKLAMQSVNKPEEIANLMVRAQAKRQREAERQMMYRQNSRTTGNKVILFQSNKNNETQAEVKIIEGGALDKMTKFKTANAGGSFHIKLDGEVAPLEVLHE